MTHESEELLSCPFCGGKPVVGGSSGKLIEAHVECKNYCGASVRRWKERTDLSAENIRISQSVYDECILAWNTRARSTPPDPRNGWQPKYTCPGCGVDYPYHQKRCSLTNAAPDGEGAGS